jgi:hypothetical protein
MIHNHKIWLEVDGWRGASLREGKADLRHGAGSWHAIEEMRQTTGNVMVAGRAVHRRFEETG